MPVWLFASPLLSSLPFSISSPSLFLLSLCFQCLSSVFLSSICIFSSFVRSLLPLHCLSASLFFPSLIVSLLLISFSPFSSSPLSHLSVLEGIFVTLEVSAPATGASDNLVDRLPSFFAIIRGEKEANTWREVVLFFPSSQTRRREGDGAWPSTRET